MTTNTNETKIIDKIKKLLALSQSTNEHEATLAMERVQSLLASYNLTMSEVARAQTVDDSVVDDAVRIKDKLNKTAMYNYQRKLMRAVAISHFCFHFVYANREFNHKTLNYRESKYHVLVGKEANVVTAKLMFEYLNGTIEKLARERYPYPANLSRSAISWKEGCTDRLVERLNDEKRKADKEQEQKAAEYAKTHANGTSIVLLTDVRQMEDDLNTDFLHGYKPGTTAARRKQWAAEYEARKAVEEQALKDKVTPPKTEAELKAEEKRAKKAAKDWERFCQSERRKREKHWASKDLGAYLDGKETGNDIGLDKQVHRTTSKSVK